jgi:hypothetical protein
MTDPIFAWRIVEWEDRFEVNEAGHIWKNGQKKRSGPLNFVRTKVHGHTLGRGYRRLLKLARDNPSDPSPELTAMAVLGVYDRYLQLAANHPENERGLIENPGEVSEVLDLPVSLIEIANNFFLTLCWIVPCEEKDAENHDLSGLSLKSQPQGKVREGKVRTQYKGEMEKMSLAPSTKTTSRSMLEEIVKHLLNGSGKTILQVDELDCIELLEGRGGFTPPILTPLTLQPLLDWIDRKKPEWAKKDPEDRTWLKTILLKRRWETKDIAPADGGGRGVSDRRCTHCGGPADGVGHDDTGADYGWCRKCQPRKWAALQAAGAG